MGAPPLSSSIKTGAPFTLLLGPAPLRGEPPGSLVSLQLKTTGYPPFLLESKADIESSKLAIKLLGEMQISSRDVTCSRTGHFIPYGNFGEFRFEMQRDVNII
jgi:hypothetical protein